MAWSDLVYFVTAPNGCGGGFGKFCEKTSPGVQFWAAYLDDQVHNLTITNVWQGNITNSYFGEWSFSFSF